MFNNKWQTCMSLYYNREESLSLKRNNTFNEARNLPMHLLRYLESREETGQIHHKIAIVYNGATNCFLHTLFHLILLDMPLWMLLN